MVKQNDSINAISVESCNLHSFCLPVCDPSNLLPLYLASLARQQQESYWVSEVILAVLMGVRPGMHADMTKYTFSYTQYIHIETCV